MDYRTFRNKYAVGAVAPAAAGNSGVMSAAYSTLQPAKVEDDGKNNGGVLGGIGYVAEKFALGTISGFEGIWDYTAGGLAKLFGADEWAEEQFANDWVNYNHADEWYDPSDGWKFAGDIAGGIGTSMPAIAGMAAGVAITGATGGAGGAVGAQLIVGGMSSLFAGLSAAGNATKEAYRETGELTGKEFGYGALSGVTEAGIELLTAGIGTGTGRIIKNVAKRAAGEVTEAFAKTGAKNVLGKIGFEALKDFGSEAFEEGLAEYISPYYKRMTYDPDAKNASWEEIRYSAIVGGFSGLVMTGGHAAVNSTSNWVSGNKAVQDGSADFYMRAAEEIAKTESENDTGYAAFKTISEEYASLNASLEKTGGVISTAQQKMLLGNIKRNVTAATIMPFAERSAENALVNADALAEKLNSYQMKGPDGKVMTFTAEQIRSGVDMALLTSKNKAERKQGVKQLRAALSTNSALSTIAIADATGRLLMDAKTFKDAALSGKAWADRADLNNFVETADADEIEAVSREFGIDDWSKLTIDELHAKIADYKASGKADAYIKQMQLMKAAKEVGSESAKPLPHIMRKNLSDGIYRYSAESVNMALIKEGEVYGFYDYDRGRISRPLSVQEVNQQLKKYWTGDAKSAAELANSVDTAEQKNTASSTENVQDTDMRYAQQDSASKKLEERIKEVADSFGIEDINDYVNVQKNVYITLRNEGFFTDEGGESKTVVNKDSGMLIEINKSSIEETFSKGAKYEYIGKKRKYYKLATIRIIDKLIENAKLTNDNIKNYHSENSSVKYAYLETEIFIDGLPAKIVIDIRKSPQKNKLWVHQVYTIENTEVDPSGAKSSKKGLINLGTDDIIFDSAENSNSSDEKTSKYEKLKKQNGEAAELAKKVKGYSSLNAKNQSVIRAIIRQGRAAGMSESFVLSCARVSARSGLNVVFSRELCFVEDEGKYADGALDMRRNRIIINPEAKSRSGEMILLHELAHAIYVKDGVVTSAEGLQYFSENEKAKIRKTYAKVANGDAAVYADEINAHFIERTLSNKNILERLLADKPTLKDKILDFFSGASTEYADDARLSGASKKLYKQYKKLFDEFSERNQGRNAYGDVGTSTESERFAQSEDVHVSMDDFANRESSLWRNVDYNDDITKNNIMQEIHADMIKDGKVVIISEETSRLVEQSFPNLRGTKKKDRTPILKAKINELKNNLRQFLVEFKHQTFEFEVNGKVLDAKLYSTGINEVLEKITQEKANMIYATEEIFRNARYLYSTPDYDGDPNIYRWNYFYTPVKIDAEIIGVRIAIRDTANPAESQIYNWGLKKDASLGDMGRGTNNRISHGASSDASNVSITDTDENGNTFDKKSFALPDDADGVANYTEKQYNDFGWARNAEALSKNELDDLYSKVQGRKTLRTFKQSSKGEAIIEVNNKPHTTLDVDNVFVFVKGTKSSFNITRVVRFAAETETEMEIIKERLYERRAFSDTHLAFLEQQRFATQYTREGAKSFSEYQKLRASGKTSGGADQNNRRSAKYRSGYSLAVGEDGEITERFALPDDTDDVASTVDSVAKERQRYKPKLKDKIFTAADSIYIDTVDEMYGVEKYLRQVGMNKSAAGIVQAIRASRSQAQTMIGNVQYDIFSDGGELGQGLQRIFKPILDSGEERGFNDYLLHHLNVDRMTLEERSKAKNEEAKAKLAKQEENLKKLNDEIERLQDHNGNIRHSLKEWHTDLNKTQYKKVEKWIRLAGNPDTTRITDTANWYKGRIDGEDLFVIYSTQDANGSTILYEVKGENAKVELDILMDLLEDEANGKSIDGKSSFAQRVSEGSWMQNVNSNQNNLTNLGARANNQNVGVLQRQSQRNGSSAFWNVLENIFRIQERNGNLRNFQHPLSAEAKKKNDAHLKKCLKEARALKKEIDGLKLQINSFVPLENKPIFGENENRSEAISAEKSRKRIAEYDKEHPEWRGIAEKVWAYAKNLNRLRAEAGLITADSEAYMNELYPHYVPAFRDFSYTGASPVKGKSNLKISQTVKRAKGSGLDVMEIATSLAEQTQEVVRAGNTNILFRAVYEAAETSGDETYVEIVSREKLSREDSAAQQADNIELRPKNNQITGYIDGEKVTLCVSREIFTAFESITKPTVDPDSAIQMRMKKINDGYKKLLTSWSPAFFIRNPIRDLQDAGLNSKHPAKFAKNLPRAAKLMFENSKEWRQYMAYGGFSSSVFGLDGFSSSMNRRGFEAFAKLLDTDSASLLGMLKVAKRAGGNVLLCIENLNAFVEQVPRFAEYLASIEAGESVQTAIYNSAEVTTNFGRKGRLAKKFNATIMPFLNPSIQGFDKMFRNVSDALTGEKVGKAICTLLIKAAAIGLAPMIFNLLMYGDDEDYEELRETDKENNFLIKAGDTFIKIPRGRVASILGGALNRAVRAANGKDPDIMGYAENVINQVTPVGNLTRTIASPFFDVANNLTWYGTAIEGRQFENKAPKDRYDESTSSIAIAIGQVFNYSPKKIHYLLDQYSGVIGDFILPMTTAKAEKGFFSGNFTIDPATSNKLSEEFYKIYDEAQYAKTAGDDTAAYQVRYLNRVKDAISDMYEEKSKIQSNTELSNAEKLQQTRVIQLLINEAYKTAAQDIELYTKAIEATASIPFEDGMTEQSYKNIRFAEATRLMYGAERALEEYDDKVYEKCQTLNLAGIDYETLYSYYFTTKGLESDTDRYGEVIDGSKRKKIVKAINALKISTEQKLLLLCAKGYSPQDRDFPGVRADTAKKRLLRYILSLNISREEKAALAEACGFEVKAGKIVTSSTQSKNKLRLKAV